MSAKPTGQLKEEAPRRPSGGSARQAMITGRDREFLPAALEILETPPAPGATVLMLMLCAFMAAAIAWSYIGRLDVDAIAQGKLEARGRTKVIQPLESGKVRSIAVENGQAVKAGDLLIEFDPTELQADVRDHSDALAGSEAEQARRSAAIAAARKTDSAEGLAKATFLADESLAPAAFAREKAVFRADLDQLADSSNDIDKKIAEKNATTQRLNLSIAFQVKLITTLNERVDMRNAGIKLSVDTKINLIDAQEALEKSQSVLASDQGQLIETTASIKELEMQKRKTISQFISDNETKRADAERKAQELTQQLLKARTKLERTRLVSPIDGTVQQLAITTIGQVVTTGQQLMAIVPSDGPLQVQAYVNNADIGFVKLGQEAVIKLDAFPFTRYGVLHGKVMKIATDAIDSQDARRAEANAISLANSASAPLSGGPRNFVYPVALTLDEGAMTVAGSPAPLRAGMTVTVEIKTESRRIIDYLFSPLAKVASEALRER
jgi:hemolysin D